MALFWRKRESSASQGVAVEQKTAAPATIAYPDPQLFSLFGSMPTKSGVDVSPYAAMRVPAVAQAVSLVSQTVATMPCRLIISQDGSKEADTAHPAHALVAIDANPWTSASALREQLTADAILHGAGYAYVNRVNGRPVEFIRLLPGSVSKQIETTTLEPHYIVGQSMRLGAASSAAGVGSLMSTPARR